MMIDIKKATTMINGSMFETDGGINIAEVGGDSMINKKEIFKSLDRKANKNDIIEIAKLKANKNETSLINTHIETIHK